MNLYIKAIQKKISDLFNSPYRSLGINFFTEKLIKHSNNQDLKSITILGNKTWYINTPELTHSLSELFFEEIYKFKATRSDVRIIDCGSHIGLSILYFKKLYANAIITGFEPDNQNYDLLNKNIAEWGYTSIDIHKAAIWTSNGLVNFTQTGGMGSQITQNEPEMQDGQTKSVRLRDLLTGPVDFLKMDIEGAEYNVLMDCAEQLKMVSNLFIEYHGKFTENHQLIGILKLLDDLDFNFYIKEASNNYKTPFSRGENEIMFEVQLNIFAFPK
jgi:FkbM family methyltransferase